jgi:hypothetical protein
VKARRYRYHWTPEYKLGIRNSQYANWPAVGRCQTTSGLIPRGDFKDVGEGVGHAGVKVGLDAAVGCSALPTKYEYSPGRQLERMVAVFAVSSSLTVLKLSDTHTCYHQSQAECPLASIDEAGALTLFAERRNKNERTYSTAAKMIRDRIPVHSDADSSIPPTSAPKRFEPSA